MQGNQSIITTFQQSVAGREICVEPQSVAERSLCFNVVRNHSEIQSK